MSNGLTATCEYFSSFSKLNFDNCENWHFIRSFSHKTQANFEDYKKSTLHLVVNDASR